MREVLTPTRHLTRVPSLVANARPIARALFELTKPRLALLSLITAMAAYAASVQAPNLAEALATCLGCAFAAGGALSWNHWMERHTDGKMNRTRHRPIPSRRLAPAWGFLWSLALSLGGISFLFFGATQTAAYIAVAIIVLYAFVYTPLKRHTRWATEIGSLSGALPPVLGCAAAGQPLHPAGLTLAAVLLFWQMPHFYAIGWRHRRDYQAAGFPLLPATDSDGRRTGRWSFAYTLCLFVASLAPWIFGWLGHAYAFGAAGAGLWMLLKAFRFFDAQSLIARDIAARKLFFASLTHITILSIAIAIDQLN